MLLAELPLRVTPLSDNYAIMPEDEHRTEDYHRPDAVHLGNNAYKIRLNHTLVRVTTVVISKTPDLPKARRLTLGSAFLPTESFECWVVRS